MDCANDRTLIHKHHIIPRYMGGTDEPTNLVEVTVTQHAMFHYCNYQLWGNEEDRLAWRGLSGIIPKQEVMLEVTKMAVELARTPEAIKKKKETFKEIGHQQGEKNSQYGKVWITDGTKEGSYRINKEDPIPEGYRLGRVSIKEENLDYVYIITTPLGEVVETKNLYAFSMNNSLTYKSMIKVVMGIRNHHKGFKVIKKPT